MNWIYYKASKHLWGPKTPPARFWKALRTDGRAFTILMLIVCRAATAGEAEARLDHVPTLRLVRDLATPGQTSGITWSSDGVKLAAMSYGSSATLPGIVSVPSPFGNLITIWNVDGTSLIKILKNNPFFQTMDTIAFANKNKLLVTPPSEQSNDLSFSIFDTATGAVVREVGADHPGQPRNVNAAIRLVTSPDQSILAVVFGRALARPVSLYSTKDWTKICELPMSAIISSATRPDFVGFSNDGRLISTVSVDGTVTIYDVQQQKMLKQFPAYPGIGATAFAFRPDGKQIAVLTNGTEPVRVYSTSDGSQITALRTTTSYSLVSSATWSSSANVIAFTAGEPMTLHLWAPTGQEEEEKTVKLDGYSESVSFSPDGKRLAIGVGQNVKIYSVQP